jgi:hypothetical protein
MRLREGFIQRLPPDLNRNLYVEGADDFFTGAWMVKVVTSLLAERRINANIMVYHREPANWWEHLRKTLGLTFQEKTIPIVVNVQQYMTYPNTSEILPEDRYGKMVLKEIAYCPDPEEL